MPLIEHIHNLIFILALSMKHSCRKFKGTPLVTKKLSLRSYLYGVFLCRFLLKKLFHYLPMTENQALQSSAALKSLAANFHGNLPPTVLGPVHPSTMPRAQGSKKKQKSKRSDKKKKDSKSKQGLFLPHLSQVSQIRLCQFYLMHI